MISMLFLGRLGNLSLAGGALAIGFANITGYSILSGLAMGMEPICGQAFGARRYKLLGLTMQKTMILLFVTSIPLGFLWCNMKKILLFCGQDDEISTQAQLYILYSLPDLFTQSLLHPLRLCELGNCPQTTGCGVLRGTACPKLGARINLGCFYLVGMPTAVWLGFFKGLDFMGLWLGLLAAQGSCVVTMLLILSRTDWDRQAQRSKELTGSAEDIKQEDKNDVETNILVGDN
ncbi:hypothetical protein AgCh_019932 [Apium graveolens]